MNSKEQLKDDLRSVGIKAGDILLVRAGLRGINAENKADFLEALLEVLTPDGTLVGLSFSDSYFFPNESKGVYSRDSATDSGGFSKAMLAHSGAYRSDHPTNSYVAIGKHAKAILGDHDETALSYTPLKKIIELDGKMLLVGCLHASPGFTTLHYAQEELGLTKLSYFRGLKGVMYKKDSKLKKFIRPDFGGCSRGFNKLYSLYMEAGVMNLFKVGDATSAVMRAKDAYPIDYKTLSENPRYLLCDNSLCISCRTTWKNNKRDIFPFWLHLFLNKVFKMKF